MFAAMMLHLVGLHYANGHEGHNSVSQFYASWFQPPTRESSCCDMTDCAVAEVRVERNGDVYARSSLSKDQHPATDGWLRVPPALIESNAKDPRDSPDGQSHLCSNSSGPICFVMGSGI